MACCGASISISEKSENSEQVDDGCFHVYRQPSPNGEMATIFDADDTKSFYSWRLELGREPSIYNGTRPRPRFRQTIDQETSLAAFELTGNHDGTVCMICPPLLQQECRPFGGMEEKFPFLNFIMTDLGAYSSIEIEITDMSNVDRKIIAKNYRSRTSIDKSTLEIPMRLKPSWNYVSLDLIQLTKDAWNTRYLITRKIRLNANFRLRRVYFTSRPFSYDELPHEFLMNLNPSVKTLNEIKKYEEALGPAAKNLDRYLRPWIKIIETKKKKSKRSSLCEGNAKTGVQNNQVVRIDEDQNRRMSTPNGLNKLSIPSNVELLKKLMNSSMHLKKNGAQSANYLWSYPKKPKKRRSRRFEVGLTRSVYKNLEERINVTSSNSVAVPEWLKDMEASDLEPFCAYIWKQTDENDSNGEWDKIQNFDINPKLLAKINKQRRGEGLYDIYNGKMVAKEEVEFFGFGDSDEKEDQYLQEKKSLQLLMQKLDYQQKDGIDFETFLSKSRKQSWEDKSGDWEFLQSASKGNENWFDSPDEQQIDVTEDDFTQPPNDTSSENHVSPRPSSNDDWLLTWTYEGMDWKQTREQNGKKLDEELGILERKSEDVDYSLVKNKELSSKPSIINSKKNNSKTPSTLSQVAIPSKPLMKPSNVHEELKNTGVFYHLYFDSKILPFRK